MASCADTKKGSNSVLTVLSISNNSLRFFLFNIKKFWKYLQDTITNCGVQLYDCMKDFAQNSGSKRHRVYLKYLASHIIFIKCKKNKKQKNKI
jgi:hypothetical protein